MPRRHIEIAGTTGNDTIIASGPHRYSIYGLEGDDVLVGVALGDRLYGDAGSDVLDGGGDDDFLSGGEGADTLIGGAGIDTADYFGSAAGVKISLATGLASGGDAKGDTLSGIENLSGSQFNDTLVGDAADNILFGHRGDDSLDGGDGNDRLLGGDGADNIDGGSGSDTIDYRQSTAGISIDLKAGTVSGGQADGDRFKNIENVNGSRHDDTIVGDAGANVLFGHIGDDLLFGGGGDDTLDGASGDDTLEGGAGADVISGSLDSDTASYATSNAGVDVNLTSGFAAGGHAQGDVLSEIENLTGSAFGDRLTGTSGDNIIQGGGGADRIRAGGGVDEVWGGAGNDLFVFNQNDPSVGNGTNHEYIGDFVAGGSEDVIDLRNAGTGFTSLNDVLAHSLQWGQGTLIDLGPSGQVYLDGVQIVNLAASDFIFV